MKFHSIAYPFADHIAVRLDHHHRARQAAIAEAMQAIGLSLIRRLASPESELVFFGTAPDRHLSDDGATYTDGYFFSDRVLLPKDQQIGSMPRAGSSLRGHGTIAFLGKDNFSFVADQLGMSQLYYFDGGPQLVTNRIDLAARVLSACGTVPLINITAAARTFCYATPFWNETAIAGLSLLPIGADVVVDFKGIRLGEQHHFSPAGRSYESLLSDAAEEIVSNVRAIVASYAGAKLTVSLSGGVDCRILLAAILAAGAEKQFGFYTYGTSTSPDRVLARGLRSYFNLREASRDPVQCYGALQAFERGFAFNWGMRTIAGDGYIDKETRDEIVLNGGCGENFRSYFSVELYEKCGESLFQMERGSVVGAFLKARLSSKYLSRDLYRAIADRVAAELERISIGNPVTDIDLLYPYYRGRYHFGLGARVRSTSTLTFSPLYSEAAISASLAVSPRQRADNCIAYDLIRRLCPRLVGIATTDGPWPAGEGHADPQVSLPVGVDGPRKKGRETPDISVAAAAEMHEILDYMTPERESILSQFVDLPGLSELSLRPGEVRNRSRLVQYAQFLSMSERLRLLAEDSLPASERPRLSSVHSAIPAVSPIVTPNAHADMRMEGSGTNTVSITSRPDHAPFQPGSSEQRPLHIALIGAFGNGNLGDKYQALAIATILRDLDPTCLISSISMNGRDIAYPTDGMEFAPRSKLDDFEALNSFDLLLVGGGGLLASPHRPLHNEAWVAGIRKPMCGVALGVTTQHARNAAAFVKGCAAFSVRDRYSKKCASKVRKDVRITMDPILLSPPLPGEILPLREDREGIVWIPAKLTPETRPFYEDAVKRLFRSETDCVVALNEPSDRKSGFDEMFGPNVYYVQTLEELSAVLVRSRLVVSERYHGCIFAIRAGLPCLGLALRGGGVTSKVRGLYEWMGLEECAVDMDTRLRRREMRKLAGQAFRKSNFRSGLTAQAAALRAYLADCLAIAAAAPVRRS